MNSLRFPSARARSRTTAGAPVAIVCLALAALVSTAPARAAIFTWNAGSGATNASVNWSPVGVPVGADEARFFPNANYNVTIVSPNDTLNTLWASGVGSPHLFGNYRIRQRALADGATSLTFASGTSRAGWFEVGPATLSITGAGTVVTSSNPAAPNYFGTASGFTSTVNVNTGATFHSTGILQVPQINGATGILNVSGHPIFGDASRLIVDGKTNIGTQGTGDLEISNGAVVQLNNVLSVGSNGNGTVHLFRSGPVTNTAPALTVYGYTYIGWNNDGSIAGPGLYSQDAGSATINGDIYVGDDDGGSGGTLRVSGGLLLTHAIRMSVSNNGHFEHKGGVIRVEDHCLGCPVSSVYLTQTSPVTISGAGNPTLVLTSNAAYVAPAASPALAIGRNAAGTVRLVQAVFAPASELTVEGDLVMADSTGGTGTLSVDSTTAAAVHGSVSVGPGNGLLSVRRGSFLSVGWLGSNTPITLTGVSSPGATLEVKEAGSELGCGALYVGGTAGGALPGPAFATVDSGGLLLTQALRVWSGGGKLFLGRASQIDCDTMRVSGETELKDGRLQSTMVQVFNAGLFHGVGRVLGQFVVDDSTGVLAILTGDTPNDTLTVGDSTRTDGFINRGTIQLERDTLEILNQGTVDIGHVVLNGGTLRVRQGGHLAAGALLQGNGRFEGDLLSEGSIHLLTGNSLTLDLAGHLTSLTGTLTGSTLNVLAGSALTTKGTTNLVLRLRGALDMGPTPASLTLSNTLSMFPTGAVTMRIGSSAGGIKDALALGQAVTLNGKLDLRTWAPDPPAVGDTITLITGPSISGTFAVVTIDGLDAPGIAQPIYSPTSVKVAILHSTTTGVDPGPGSPATSAVLRFAAVGGTHEAALALDLPTASNVRVALYDVTGRQIAELQDGAMEPGPHRFALREETLASGIYFGRAWVGTAKGTRVLSVRVVHLR